MLGWGGREHHDDFIPYLWVSPQAQRRGVGGALLSRLEADISSAGYGFAKLATHAANVDAIRFYQRHGYALTARVREFSAPLGYEIDKVRLAKPLSKPPVPADRGTEEKP